MTNEQRWSDPSYRTTLEETKMKMTRSNSAATPDKSENRPSVRRVRRRQQFSRAPVLEVKAVAAMPKVLCLGEWADLFLHAVRRHEEPSLDCRVEHEQFGRPDPVRKQLARDMCMWKNGAAEVERAEADEPLCTYIMADQDNGAQEHCLKLAKRQVLNQFACWEYHPTENVYNCNVD